MNPYEIIKRPINTEKSDRAVDYNQYTFEVDRRANKVQIAEAVAEIFGVDVIKVNVINRAAKFGRWGRKTVKRKPAMKKAIVTIAPGQRIDFFEGV
ncbi:MAG: 50S ribosomal protein L23 [Anaerolineae bacterium]